MLSPLPPDCVAGDTSYERTASNFAQEDMGVRDDGTAYGGGGKGGHMGLGGHRPAQTSDQFNSFRSR